VSSVGPRPRSSRTARSTAKQRPKSKSSQTNPCMGWAPCPQSNKERKTKAWRPAEPSANPKTVPPRLAHPAHHCRARRPRRSAFSLALPARVIVFIPAFYSGYVGNEGETNLEQLRNGGDGFPQRGGRCALALTNTLSAVYLRSTKHSLSLFLRRKGFGCVSSR
jgi:hypothetical protein